MDAAGLQNPFLILSYIAGPALLTNATALLTVATTTRFARSVDRSRALLAEICEAPVVLRPLLRRDLEANQHRARVIARAMGALYLAFGMFALATMLSLLGAVFAQFEIATLLGIDTVAGLLSGGVGFVALVVAAVALIEESRLALSALKLEAEVAELRLGSEGCG